MRLLIFRSLVLLVATSTIAVLLVNPDNYSKAMNLNTEENPLLAKWEGPYGGNPPFDRVQISLFKPALEASMTEQLAEIDRIAKDPAPPDFQNTIAALERSGRMMERVSTIYG